MEKDGNHKEITDDFHEKNNPFAGQCLIRGLIG